MKTNMSVTKEQYAMISGALKDLENSIYDRLERAKNEVEMMQVESLEELKEISRLVKKLK